MPNRLHFETEPFTTQLIIHHVASIHYINREVEYTKRKNLLLRSASNKPMIKG